MAGGSDEVGPLARTEIYDSVSNRWFLSGDMIYPRNGHTATLLNTGQVLIAGGESQGAVQNALELFDPESNSFSRATWEKQNVAFAWVVSFPVAQYSVSTRDREPSSTRISLPRAFDTTPGWCPASPP